MRDRLPALTQARGVALGMSFPGGTSIRAHAKAVGASKKRDLAEAAATVRRLSAPPISLRGIGRSPMGALVAATAPRPQSSRTEVVGPSPSGSRRGRRTNSRTPFFCSTACPACRAGSWADRGYASRAFREHVWNAGARPAIPAKRNEAPVACPGWAYRNRVERLWGRLKEGRAVATRYGKTAASFLGVLRLAASMDWFRR